MPSSPISSFGIAFPSFTNQWGKDSEREREDKRSDSKRGNDSEKLQASRGEHGKSI